MGQRSRSAPTDDWAQLRLLAGWPEQVTYELLRPIVLFGRSPAERAKETGAAERTLYRQADRFDRLGMQSLFAPAKVAKHHRISAGIRQHLLALKAQHPAFRVEELVQIGDIRFGRRLSHHTVKRILAEGPLPPVEQRRFPRYHAIPTPVERRLNRSADGIYMEGVLMRLRRRGRGLGQRLQRAAVAGLHLGGATRQPGEELGHLLLHLGLAAQAGVGGDLLARPGPDGLVGVAVGAVGRQAEHPQGEIGGRQLRAHRVAPVRRAVVPDHAQRPEMVGAQLPEERRAGRGRARPGQFHVLDRPGLQADR